MNNFFSHYCSFFAILATSALKLYYCGTNFKMQLFFFCFEGEPWFPLLVLELMAFSIQKIQPLLWEIDLENWISQIKIAWNLLSLLQSS